MSEFYNRAIDLIRHLTSEAAAEWQELTESNTKGRDQLNKLIHDIVPYLMSHNAEAEACDLMMEVEKMNELIQYVDDTAYTRVCLYLKRSVVEQRHVFVHVMNDTFLLIAAAAAYNNVSAVTVSVCRTCFCCSCVPYVPEPEDRNLMKTALSIYRKFDKWPDAMICAISLNDMDLIKEIFLDCKDG